ncbi:hypothetical protein ACQI4L_09060 [Mycolicibacterium litorale]|uniref:hypothetical protein n=1 Tax=Mycolicibacterium litorale TaxID=758802 RepID=UPI003CF5D6F1
MDLLDFYRGDLSVRTLGVLVRQLSVDSALTRSLNGGRKPWGQLEHLIADVWVVLVKILNPKSRVSDHPTRAEMETKRHVAAKQARVAELRAKYEKRKRTYGLG